jgi:hypothetical protein
MGLRPVYLRGAALSGGSVKGNVICLLIVKARECKLSVWFYFGRVACGDFDNRYSFGGSNTRVICCQTTGDESDCSTYMRSIHAASMLYANDDRKGRLPQGGYHRIESNGNIIDRDDAIGMLISDFLRLSKYIVSMQNLPTEYETVMRMTGIERARLIDSCIKDGGGKVFVCPEMFKIKTTVYDQLRRKYVTLGEVYFSQPVDYARIGYSYLGGFETEKWNYNGFAGLSNPRVEKWNSPMTLASKGDAVLIADRTRHVPKGENWNPSNFVDYQHGSGGYSMITNVGDNFDHTRTKAERTLALLTVPYNSEGSRILKCGRCITIQTTLLAAAQV